MNTLKLLTIISLLFAAACPAAEVLVEAESFTDRGGWKIDQQFMDQMGSPYLLAHGLGYPVRDAVTTVAFPRPGSYRVWVRTFDWVAPWKTPETPASKRATGTPGKFRLMINAARVETVFGTEGAAWHWQPGGRVEVKKGPVELRLVDMTGFDGRCDAILFSDDPGFQPPDGGEKLASLRRTLLGTEKTRDAGEYDLVVVGGGISGICAAVSGARNGLTVALIQDRPVLGGNNSSEVRVWLSGRAENPRYPNVGRIVRELDPIKRAHSSLTNTADYYPDEKREAFVRSEKNISLFLCHRANGIEVRDERILSVTAQDIITGVRKRFSGRWFVDTTGDGCVGYHAGADFEMTETAHMGQSNLWNIRDTGQPVSFPRCPWAYDLSDKPFPGRDGNRPGRQLGTWFWESGCFRHPIDDRERNRDNNFRAMFGAWDCLKNVQEKFPNYQLAWAAYVSGPRESRRLLGDVILNKEDLLEYREYDDGCIATGWKIDLHLPRKEYSRGFEGDEFITRAHFTGYKMPYYVPYRCLYSRNIENLFMAGRDVSVTHEALGAVRVMRTCGQMGDVVGMAAAICKKRGTTPRGVYKEHLDELKKMMSKGPPPEKRVRIWPASEATRTSDGNPINEMPEELGKLTCVTIERGSWRSPAPGFRFEIGAAAVVYIAVHDRGDYRPPKGWEQAGMTMTWREKYTDTVYRKRFAAGTVAIPSHSGNEGNKTYGLPHMAFVKPAAGGSVDVRPVSP